MKEFRIKNKLKNKLVLLMMSQGKHPLISVSSISPSSSTPQPNTGKYCL